MSLFALIPILPLVVFLALAAGGRRWGQLGHRLAIPAVGLSCALSVGAFGEVVIHGPFSISLYRLFRSGPLAIDLGLYVDQLTVLLLVLITGVSTVVHVFSSRYMIGDPRYNRFFAVIALVTFSMLMVVMSSNLLMFYVFWEVMGLCSYLLISHWAERPTAIRAATKVFLVNAVADVGLGFGVILAYFTFGTLDIQTMLSRAESLQGQTINLLGWVGGAVEISPVTLMLCFLFMGVMGKSAQLPFQVWLPAAMEAPTPASALNYAATMVNAGPFLLARLSPLLVMSPAVMTGMTVVGAVTALFAAMVSLAQSDIKKHLAFSTVSQTGLTIMACGIGAFVAAMFHLLAHGLLKAFLFLSTGNALQLAAPRVPSSSRQAASSPPWVSLWVGSFLLACLPPFVIFSGPYEAVWAVQGFSPARWVFWLVGLATVFLTGMYVFRGVHALFQTGPMARSQGPSATGTGAPAFFSLAHLTLVLVSGGVIVGMLMTVWMWLVGFLSPVLGGSSFSRLAGSSVLDITWGIGLPLGVAVAGWAYAAFRRRDPQQDAVHPPVWSKAAYVFFLNKGYADELYEAYLVQPALRVSHWLWQRIDLQGIDRLVLGTATVAVGCAKWLWQVVDLKGIDRLTVNMGRQSLGLGHWLWRRIDIRALENTVEHLGTGADAVGRRLQEAGPRTLQHHLLVMIFWLVLVIGLLYVLAIAG